VENLVVDLRECGAGKISKLIDDAYLSREKIQSDLVRRMPSVRQQVANLFARTVSERKDLLRLDKKTAPVPV